MPSASRPALRRTQLAGSMAQPYEIESRADDRGSGQPPAIQSSGPLSDAGQIKVRSELQLQRFIVQVLAGNDPLAIVSDVSAGFHGQTKETSLFWYWAPTCRPCLSYTKSS